MASVCQHAGTLAFCSGNLITAFAVGKCTSSTYKCPAVQKKKEEQDEANQTKDEGSSSDSILCSRFSSCGRYFAVCDDNKQLIIWQTGDEWKVHSVRSLVRRCTSLVFTKTSDAVLVADKSGDVYQYSVSNSEQEGQLLLGHVSMLFDIVLAGDDKFVVTCDRDEKVRVTCYPNTHSIQSYCLGHTEFVSRLTYLEKQDIVLSGSGDGTLRIWDYREGLEVSCRDCSKDLSLNEGEFADVSQLTYSSSHNLLIVAFDKRKCVLVYKLTDSSSLDLVQRLECEADVWSLCLDEQQQQLWVLLKQQSNVLQVFSLSTDPSLQFLPVSADNKEVSYIQQQLNLDSAFYKASENIECVFSALHKAKIDNMKKYLEQKHERMKSGQKGKERMSEKEVLPSGEDIENDSCPETKKAKLS